MKNINIMIRKWTKEKCYNEARKYKTKKDFLQNSRNAYKASWKNKWLIEYDWFVRPYYKLDLNAKIHLIYAYEFKNENYVYIGRTKDFIRRKKSHKKDKQSAVYKFCIKNNVSFVEPTLLEQNLDAIESQIKEDYWIGIYIENGWNILNIAKTGKNIGSLGCIGIIWDEQTTYNEAKKYNCKSHFNKHASGAYRAAFINKWLKSYDWMSKNKNNQTHEKNYWNYSNCYNEALKCANKKEFEKKSETAFKVACKHKWLNDYTWFVNPKKSRCYWNYDTCKEESKKYKNRKEFYLKANTAYKLSLKNKWLDEFYGQKKNNYKK